MKELLKGLVFYFINHILNKIPSRGVRMFFYLYLSGKKISRKATIGLNVKILDIRGVEIGCYTNINFDSILDGRGAGIYIGMNVDIAPQVNIWSLEHNPRDPKHSTKGEKVNILDGCWLANRVVILPGSVLRENVAVGASSLVHGTYEPCCLLLGEKARVKGNTFSESKGKINPIRVFR